MIARYRRGLSLAAGAFAAALAGPTAAQVATSIVADTGSAFSTGTSVSRLGAVTTIDGGTRAGANLFHSFSAFNLGVGDTARWTAANPAGVANVVNRVTGGSYSTISGTIDTTALPNASFYFINPAGVLFTPGAQLNVPNAAYVSTAAGGLRFADGLRFSAVTPGGSTFSMAAPESFGFLGGEGNVVLASLGTNFVGLGTGLSLTAANVGVQDSSFTPYRFDAVSTGGQAATITLADPLSGAPLAGQVALLNAKIFTTATGKGFPSVRIATGAFTQTGGSLTSSSFFAGDAGDVILQAQTAEIGGVVASNTGEDVANGDGGTVAITVGSLHVGDGGQVSSSTFGRGAAGAIVIAAHDVLVEGTGSIDSNSGGATTTGPAGTVQIDATTLTVRNGGEVASTTNSLGDAGTVRITAGTVTLDNGAVDSVTLDESGHGGLVSIDADVLDIRNGGGAGSFTGSVGDAGTVQIKAGAMTLSSAGNIFSTSSLASPGAGTAGDISITAGSLTLADSYISSDASGGGHAGVVTIGAGTLSLSNSVISSSASGAGAAGDVTLTAGALTATNNSLISSGAFGAGAGGQVSITADKVLLDFSEIQSRADIGSTGAAGTVLINAGQLHVTDQTEISSATYGAGDAGTVSIVAKDIVIDGGSDIVSRSIAPGAGAAGQVAIRTGTLALDGSVISSTTNTIGNAGGVTIAAGQLTMANASSIESGAGTGAQGNGGTVDITADVLALNTASVIVTSTLSAGNAGQLVVSAHQLTVDHALLASRATGDATGAAGSVGIKTGSLLVTNDGQIETSSSNPYPAGPITIASTGPVTITGDLSHVSSENLSDAGGAAGSIVISGAPILVSESGYISTNATAGPAGDISLLIPNDSYLKLEGRDAPGVVTTSSGPGTGGKIVISNPLAVISNGGSILALGQQNGANVQLQSDVFIRSTDRINLLSVDGVLVVDSQVGDVSTGVAIPDVSFLDASGVLRGQCLTARSDGVTSQLSLRAVGPYVALPQPEPARRYGRPKRAPAQPAPGPAACS